MGNANTLDQAKAGFRKSFDAMLATRARSRNEVASTGALPGAVVLGVLYPGSLIQQQEAIEGGTATG
jgi:hypothetical protein